MALVLQSLTRAQPESSAVANICASTSPLASPALFHFVMRMYISHEEVCWGHSLLVLGRVKSAASKSLMAAGVVGGRSVRAATLTAASWTSPWALLAREHHHLHLNAWTPHLPIPTVTKKRHI